MTAALKTYSVTLNWNDRQRDEGTYGDTVRARDESHAERIVRARMMRQQWDEWNRIDKSMSKSDIADIYATDTIDGVRYFGSLIEVSEGVSWKASDMEKALRDIIASSDANDMGSLANAIDAARAIITAIDKIT